MKFVPLETNEQVAAAVAHLIIHRINAASKEHRNIVLGLSVGISMARVYQLLVDAFQAGIVDFSHVITFNVDEFVGLPADHPETSTNFMMANLFNYVNIIPQNIHILNGNAVDFDLECENYELEIATAGGIDILVTPAGADGYIGYNEAYSSLQSRTRMKHLSEQSLARRRQYFLDDGVEPPCKALTMGIGTFLETREIVVIALGMDKARTVMHAVEGEVSHRKTVAAVIQMHSNCLLVTDHDAVAELKVKTYRYFKRVRQAAIEEWKTVTRNTPIEELLERKHIGVDTRRGAAHISVNPTTRQISRSIESFETCSPEILSRGCFRKTSKD